MHRATAVWRLAAAALTAGLSACALAPGGAGLAADSDPQARPYHAFELGVAADAGTLRDLRWQYGDIGPLLKPVAVGTGVAFMLRRQAMPVPAQFEVSWRGADGVRRQARVPVLGHLPGPVAGRSLLFMVGPDRVTGELLTYTPRGDRREPFASVVAQPLAD